MELRHFEDELQEMVDGRLRPEVRTLVEEHLTACAECRRTRERLSFVRQSLRAGLPVRPVPGDVVAGVADALDREDRRLTALRQAGQPVAPRGRSALAWGILAAAAAALVFVFLATRQRLPSAVSEDFSAYKSGVLTLGALTSDPAALEAYFAGAGVAFRTRVFDLGMMRYRLVGGRVHSLRGRPSAFFVYQGPGDKILVCQMYQGRTSELPRATETRRHGDFTFRIYRRGKQTLVFWQEGSVMCVLASDTDPEEVIQLAFAKAMSA